MVGQHNQKAELGSLISYDDNVARPANKLVWKAYSCILIEREMLKYSHTGQLNDY